MNPTVPDSMPADVVRTLIRHALETRDRIARDMDLGLVRSRDDAEAFMVHVFHQASEQAEMTDEAVVQIGTVCGAVLDHLFPLDPGRN